MYPLANSSNYGDLVWQYPLQGFADNDKSGNSLMQFFMRPCIISLLEFSPKHAGVNMIKPITAALLLSLSATAFAQAPTSEQIAQYTAAAERGEARAQFNLGSMYENGEGVPEDDATAVKWYTKAAEQGNANAQSNLGLMYDHGRGVPEDDATAVQWYRKAAEQGDANAQSNLGLMYNHGDGVPEDDVTAYMWFNLAAAQENESAETLKGVVQLRMTPADISKAQKLSRECLAKDYKDCG